MRTPGRRAAARLLLAAVWAALAAPLAAQAQAAEAPTVIYLMRHAEDAEEGNDPPLVEAGLARAAALRDLLLAVPLDAVHSTAYARTRQTAEATARAQGLEVRSYDPSALGAFAARLRSEGGVHLVVGHSNTTPEMVRLLGGEPGPPIPESEFGRLYVLVIDGDEVRTVVVRLGGG